MTIVINNVSPYIQYTATAGQVTFAYPFPIYANTELDIYKVAVGTAPDDTTDKLVLTVDYSVTGVGAEGGGTIVLTAGCTTGDTITIKRNTDVARTSQFAVNFTAGDLNTDLNKVIMMVQDVNAKIDKLLPKYGYTLNAPTADKTLPQLGASQIWRKNAANTGIAAVSIEEGAGWSTLRSELLNKVSGADGARLIGYYDGLTGQTSLNDKLDTLSSIYYANTTGLNDYSITLGGYTHHSVRTILLVDFLNQNTSRTCTLSINGLSPIPIKYDDGNNLWYGDLVSAKWSMLVYTDAGYFHVINPNRYDGFIGEMKWFSGVVATPLPDKWMMCYGQAISRTTYNALFAYLGTTWGAGDGSTTFNIPNYNDKMICNSGFEDVSHSGGERNHTLSIAEIPAHTHSPATPKYITQDASIENAHVATGSASYGLTPAPSAGGGAAHNNMPPYAVANLAIKVI